MSNPGAPDIRKALETRLAAIAAPLATQWENKTFVPVAGTPYQNVNLLLAEPLNLEMGGMYQQSGYMQVTLRYSIGDGPALAEVRAQAIRDWFYKGLQVAANGITVTINKTPSIVNPFNDGDRYCIPVKVRFFANVPV